MKVRSYFLLIIVLVFAVFACQSGGRQPDRDPLKTPSPEPGAAPLGPVPENQAPTALPEAPDAAGEQEFDPASISPELFQSTKIDVQHFIAELNRIIRAKDYHAWVSNLEESYFQTISSADFLQQLSESAFLQSRHIVLKTPQDYFFQVVVPSRANSRVDDIEFISPTRVKAYTVSSGGQRLRLYDLEHSGGGWKIIN